MTDSEIAEIRNRAKNLLEKAKKAEIEKRKKAREKQKAEAEKRQKKIGALVEKNVGEITNFPALVDYLNRYGYAIKATQKQ